MAETTSSVARPNNKKSPTTTSSMCLESLKWYKSLPKVSLVELHSFADASLEWDFRTRLFQCLKSQLQTNTNLISHHPQEYAHYKQYWSRIMSNSPNKRATTADPTWSWIYVSHKEDDPLPTDDVPGSW